MRVSWSRLLTLAALVAATCLAWSISETDATSNSRLANIFSFDSYKARFHKNYNSMLENLARQKLFLGRALSAALSHMSFTHKKSSSYEAVNQMSDWTDDEFASAVMLPSRKSDPKVSKDDANKPEEELPAVEPKVLEDEVEKIKIKSKEEGSEVYRAIASELDSSPAVRRPQASDHDSGEAVEEHSLKPSMLERVRRAKGSDYVSGLVLATASLFSRKYNKKAPKDSLPDEVFNDHRLSGCLQPPGNQRTCKSCYIFSSIAIYEWLYCMSTGGRHKAKFSEQFVLDCGGWTNHLGCNGGDELNVFAFTQSQGLELGDDYRYRAFVETCPLELVDDSEDDFEMRLGYLKFGADEESSDEFFEPKPEQYDNLIKRGPLVASIHLPRHFQMYGGGVHPGVDCLKKDNLHSMLMVGDGRENGREYWLFKNSFSATWGEQGYFKLAKESDCFVNVFAPVLYNSTDLDYGSFTKNSIRDTNLILKHRKGHKLTRAMKTLASM